MKTKLQSKTKTQAKSITTGTSHFKSEASAFFYFSAYGYSRRDVLSKIASGEITIGKPAVKPNEVLSLHPREGRYFITENPAPAYIQKHREAQEAGHFSPWK